MTLEFQQKLKRILDLIQAMDKEPAHVYRCALCANNSVNIYRSRNVGSIEDIKMVAKDEKGFYIGLSGDGDGPEGFSLGFGTDITTDAGTGIPGMFFDGTGEDYPQAVGVIIGYLRDGVVPEMSMH